MFYVISEQSQICSLLNLFHTRTILTIEYIFFHLDCRLCVWGEPVVVLCKAPILFNEIQLGVEHWVEITDLSWPGDKFLQLQPLNNKGWLIEQKLATTICGCTWLAFEPLTLSRESGLWPQAMFTNNDLHPLELSWVFGVHVREIEVLGCAIQEGTGVYLWVILTMSPTR